MPKILILILIILGLILFFPLNFKEKIIRLMIGETETELEIPRKEIGGKISIITVYDNYLADSRLETGWGFSCFIRQLNKEENILFDTGADSETLLSNMEKMEIDPKQVDIIALSHIHGDHVGGLEGFLKKNGDVKVYIPISFPDSIREEIKSHGGGYIDVSKPKKILEGTYSTGELGVLIKEQSLILNTEKGLVIITGCSHPGIVNIIKKAKEIINENVYLVLGGFHLTGAADSELKDIISDFKKLGVQKVAPCHCSGDRCRELFKKEYQEDFIENGVGNIIEI